MHESLPLSACFYACSVLVDMTKTAGDFRAAANKALEAAADGLLPRLRPILDEVGTVRVVWRSGRHLSR
jgi:hypothetical protein